MREWRRRLIADACQCRDFPPRWLGSNGGNRPGPARANGKRRERKRRYRHRHRDANLRGPRRPAGHQQRQGRRLEGAALAGARRRRAHPGMGAGRCRRRRRVARRRVQGARRGGAICGAGPAGRDVARRVAAVPRRDFLARRRHDGRAGAPGRAHHAQFRRHVERARPRGAVRRRRAAPRGAGDKRGRTIGRAGRDQGLPAGRRREPRRRRGQRRDLRPRRAAAQPRRRRPASIRPRSC